ncbi:MAG: tryptophan-rich sensory protein [Oscillospiraceae bacterium]|nr:tryptophan-rich sensory protein [Oscillospiraceae bacterium]
MNKSLKTKIIFILTALAVGGLSAYLTKDSMNIFDTVTKPPLAPPPIVFPIVWSILYTLMGYGAARVYLENPDSDALTVYWINLIINFFWSIIFFNFRNFGFAFLWLVLLFIVVLIMTVKFYRVDKVAGLLQIPYLIWLVIAGYLNLYIYLTN